MIEFKKRYLVYAQQRDSDGCNLRIHPYKTLETVEEVEEFLKKASGSSLLEVMEINHFGKTDSEKLSEIKEGSIEWALRMMQLGKGVYNSKLKNKIVFEIIYLLESKRRVFGKTKISDDNKKNEPYGMQDKFEFEDEELKDGWVIAQKNENFEYV